MDRRLLAVDVGNTHTTLGLFEGSVLRESWRMGSRESRTGDELWVILQQFLNGQSSVKPDLNAISISSVVPELTFSYRRMSEDRFGIHPLVITHDSIKSLRIDYDPPSAVGADRLCGAVAAHSRYGAPLIVVDLGTATVFDVVDSNAVYRGGLIAPGIQTSIEALHGRAALLPRVDTLFPVSVIGGNTEEAIRSGILYGAAITVEGIIKKIEEELGRRAAVVATGGFVEILKPHCIRLENIEPNLVLEGIRIITDQQ